MFKVVIYGNFVKVLTLNYPKGEDVRKKKINIKKNKKKKKITTIAVLLTTSI